MFTRKNHGIRLNKTQLVELKTLYSVAMRNTNVVLGPAAQQTYDKAMSGTPVYAQCYNALVAELTRMRDTEVIRLARAENDSVWGGVYAK